MRGPSVSGGPWRPAREVFARGLVFMLIASSSGLYARGQGPEPTKGAVVPVVFVPGTSGSILKLADGSTWWLDSTTIQGTKPTRGKLSDKGDQEGVEALTPGGVLDSVGFVLPASITNEIARLGRYGMVPYDPSLLRVPVYRDFLAWGRATFGEDGFHAVSYDWRLGAGEAASKRIDAVVDEALAKTGAKKVILIGHSLGGLVCRDYIAGAGKGKVDALISAGTPWLGAPKTARGLEWGYNFGVGFTARPAKLTDNLNLYWYVKDASHPGTLVRKEPPLRISFLSNDATAGLARNFPCVYQQVPTAGFQAIYGKSIAFGLSPDAALARLRARNPALYDAALDWRKRHMAGDDYGVAHVAIAGVCDPSGDPGEFQEMQMALPGDEFLTSRGGSVFDFLNERLIKERKRVFDEIKTRLPLYIDEFIAMEIDPGWGDGTAPLLSATAGAQLKAGAALDVSVAEKVLGRGTKVSVHQLERPYSHSSILNDLGVRQDILRVVSERRVSAGLTPFPQAEQVGILTLELTTKAGDLTFGTVENVTLEVAGRPFRTNNVFFQGSNIQTDRLSSGETARYYYHFDPAPATAAALTLKDVLGSRLRLSKSGLGRWTCGGVRLLVDGKAVFQSQEEFTLTREVPAREFVIPAR